MEEEVAQPAPQKSKKKKTRKDEVGPNQKKAHERTLSLVKKRKGVDEVSVGSPIKTFTTPHKHKGKEKVPEPMVKLIHFVQTLLKEHMWEWWMSQK